MPSTAFNPFNPFSYVNLWQSPPSVFPTQPRVPARTPIEIKPGCSDPGSSMTQGPNSVTIRGSTEGPEVHRYFDGDVKYLVSRGMSFTLDIDKAPTVDVFGKTDYTAKNHRLFTLDTSKGWSASKCAQMLADKVNAQDDFKAAVKTHRDGSATIEFARR